MSKKSILQIPELYTPRVSVAPRVVLTSPHPDDEIFLAPVALRLQASGYMIENISVTLGSDRGRQLQREQEARNACSLLDFGFHLPRSQRWYCLESINSRTRSEDPDYWNEAVTAIEQILLAIQPSLILVPHRFDWHPTHVGAHLLLFDALEKLEIHGNYLQCFVLETEIWQQMDSPNLLIESSVEEVKRMTIAFLHHIGELERSDYPLRLLWLLATNPMRSEVIAGKGTSSPRFSFATLHRAMLWGGGRYESAFDGGKFVSCDDNVADLFPAETLEEIFAAA